MADDGGWSDALIPRLAWEYNVRPLVFTGRAAARRQSWLETSGNLILQAFRRTGDEIELRLYECTGAGSEAMLRLSAPHRNAALTNLLGEERQTLKPASKANGATEYRFAVRPQQIVTVRFKTAGAVAPVQTLTTFDSIVPESKRAATRGFDHPELKGHPPRTGEPEWLKMDH